LKRKSNKYISIRVLRRAEAIFGLEIQKDSPQSFANQLTNQLREAILNGRLQSGTQLPPTRLLAKEIAVARNVVIQAYEQLLAEGYLESRVGSGTYISQLTLDDYRRPEIKSPPALTYKTPLQKREPIDFNPGCPDLSLFPRQIWGKILKEICQETSSDLWNYGTVEGEESLRRAVAGYLYRTKGLQCSFEQIIITSGIAQGADLTAHLFFKPGCAIVEEDPCDCFTRHIFRHNGYRIIPVPVDQDGLCTDALPNNTDINLIYLVPSHQFPIGSILPIRRRLDLIAYARRQGAYIIEDDYDSEFRFDGEPIQPLQKLAPDHVIYMGTFSKTFSPGIRLGFMLVPEKLVEPIRRLKEQFNMLTPALIQLAMARFIESKAYDRHIFKMKKVYETKRKLLMTLLQEAFGKDVRISGANAGLHLLLEFKGRDISPTDLEHLKSEGIIVDRVEEYTLREGDHRNQLVLGYGGLSNEEITRGVEILRKVLG
jgi:GntR family transcriptional regulator/MocR family aminotransferase